MAKNAKATYEAALQGNTVVLQVDEGTCGDGCGQPVSKGRLYRQGHDARLRSVLYLAHRAGNEIAFIQNGTRKTGSAAAAISGHGFPPPAERKPRAKKSTAKKSTAKKSTARKTTAKRKTAARKTSAAK